MCVCVCVCLWVCGCVWKAINSKWNITCVFFNSILHLFLLETEGDEWFGWDNGLTLWKTDAQTRHVRTLRRHIRNRTHSIKNTVEPPYVQMCSFAFKWKTFLSPCIITSLFMRSLKGDDGTRESDLNRLHCLNFSCLSCLFDNDVLRYADVPDEISCPCVTSPIQLLHKFRVT